MKIRLNIFLGALLLWVVSGMISCKKNDQGGTGAPTVSRIRLLSKTDTLANVVHRITLDSNNVYNETRVVAFDSTVTSGKLNTQYAILGTNLLTTNSVSFNGVPAYFNPGLLTDNSIIITIPANIPFGPSQSNKVTIVTKYGTVDYTFGIQQPPPMIAGFDPMAAGAGTIVTITGSVFNAVSAVKFDTTPARIVGTPTTTQIQVEVPAGVVQAYIYITTPGGTTKSSSAFGFKSLIYDDVFVPGWGSYFGYNSTRDYANTAHPKRGTYAISTIFTDAYGALQIGYNGAMIDVKKLGLTSLKLSIYGGAGTDGKSVQVVINGAYVSAFKLALSAGAYTDYTIPLSALGNPAIITEFVIQSAGGNVPSTIYVDDIGFI